MRRIVMLEMIKTPFLAAKGEVRDVDSETAIDLEKHGVAQFVIEEEQAPVSNSEVTDFNRKARRSRNAE